MCLLSIKLPSDECICRKASFSRKQGSQQQGKTIFQRGWGIAMLHDLLVLHQVAFNSQYICRKTSFFNNHGNVQRGSQQEGSTNFHKIRWVAKARESQQGTTNSHRGGWGYPCIYAHGILFSLASCLGRCVWRKLEGRIYSDPPFPGNMATSKGGQNFSK